MSAPGKVRPKVDLDATVERLETLPGRSAARRSERRGERRCAAWQANGTDPRPRRAASRGRT